MGYGFRQREVFSKKTNNFKFVRPRIKGDSTDSPIFRQTGIFYGIGVFDRNGEYWRGCPVIIAVWLRAIKTLVVPLKILVDASRLGVSPNG